MDGTPHKVRVRSIGYGMVCIRPDLAYAASIVRRFMANAGQVHWQACNLQKHRKANDTGVPIAEGPHNTNGHNNNTRPNQTDEKRMRRKAQMDR